MNDEEILQEVKKFGKVKSVVTKEKDKYVVSVMKSYSEGEGLGSMGSVSVLDIQFKTKASAERLNDKIKKLR